MIEFAFAAFLWAVTVILGVLGACLAVLFFYVLFMLIFKRD